MTVQPHRKTGEIGPAPTDLRLLLRPLDFIAEDHERIRAMCELIEEIIEQPAPAPRRARHIAAFIRAELPVLIADEEDDLLPMMLRRCLPEDEIHQLRARLDAEHDKALYLLPDALAILDKMAAGTQAEEVDRHLLQDFARHLHLHLIFENAILIPLARARLIRRDIETLRRRMMKRRGLSSLPAADTADPAAPDTDDRGRE